MSTMPDDNALMLRFQSGDTAAFESLYGRHKGPLYRYFLRLAPQDCADDLFQEAWMRLVKGTSRYAPTAPFPAYLYRIAHTVLVDHFRRTGRHPTALDVGTDELPDPAAGPAAAHEQLVLRARIAAALERLPTAQREAFLLQQEGGLTLEQIAQVVGSNREAVKSRLRYAVNKLKEALREEREPMERSA
jgi:RNA polymerase sigma-70 factor, ECF subfamily